MLMHRTPTRVLRKPPRDARPVEPAQTLQPRHRHAHLELLQADGALGAVDAVLLRRRVGEHAGPPLAGAAAARFAACGRGAVGAVRGDADVDVGLALGLEVGEAAGRELAVADGAFVFLGELGWVWGERAG